MDRLSFLLQVVRIFTRAGRSPPERIATASLYRCGRRLATTTSLVLPDGLATRGAAISWRVIGRYGSFERRGSSRWSARTFSSDQRTTQSVKKACKRPPPRRGPSERTFINKSGRTGTNRFQRERQSSCSEGGRSFAAEPKSSLGSGPISNERRPPPIISA